jgi:hypothetical protein
MLAEMNPGTRKMHNLQPLTDKQIRDAERDKVYIFNVSNKEHRIFLEKLYVIPACKPGEPVSEPLVIPGVVYTTKVSKVQGLHVEYDWHPTDGIDKAKDVLGTAPFKSASENLIPYGVFISETPEASQEATAAATKEWKKKCSDKIREADNAYALNNGRVDIGGGRSASNISDDAIEACKYLGVSRPWASNEVESRICEECGTQNTKSAARCKNQDCRCIFDEEKCRQRFPEMFAHERQKPGPKPKEVAA